MNSLFRADRRPSPNKLVGDRRRAMRGAYLTSVLGELNKKFIEFSEQFVQTCSVFTIDFSHANHVVVSFYTSERGDTRIPRTLITNQRIYPKRQCWGKLSYNKKAERVVLTREVRVEEQITVRPKPILQIAVDLGEYNPSNADMENIFFGSTVEVES